MSKTYSRVVDSLKGFVSETSVTVIAVFIGVLVSTLTVMGVLLIAAVEACKYIHNTMYRAGAEVMAYTIYLAVALYLLVVLFTQYLPAQG